MSCRYGGVAARRRPLATSTDEVSGVGTSATGGGVAGDGESDAGGQVLRFPAGGRAPGGFDAADYWNPPGDWEPDREPPADWESDGPAPTETAREPVPAQVWWAFAVVSLIAVILAVALVVSVLSPRG